MTTLLSTFATHLHAKARRDGSYRATCPFCKRGPTRRHAFNLRERTYRCTACHAHGSLATLAIYVTCPEASQDGSRQRTPRVPETPETASAPQPRGVGGTRE
jgi:hypothetical protein